MKYLVTGGSGLVGKSLTERLNQYNIDKLRVTSHKTLVDGNFEICTGDLENYEFCNEITKDIDTVYHLAAQSYGSFIQGTDPASLVRPNVVMNANLMDAAYRNGVKKFIYLVSTTGYAATQDDVKEENLMVGDPPDVYMGIGWVKRYSVKLCEFYSKYVPNPMTCICLLPSNLYSANDKFDFAKCHVLPALVRRFAERQNPLEVWGDPTKTTRDFLYVEDMVDAIIAASAHNEFDTFNIASGKQNSIADVINLLSVISGHHPVVKRLEGKPAMIANRGVNIEKARNILGWEPTTSLIDGLTKTYLGYKERFHV